MKDQVVQVRDTAAWSLGRICQIMQDMVVNAKVLQPLLAALVDGLAMEPRVATNACWVSLGGVVGKTVVAYAYAFAWRMQTNRDIVEQSHISRD